MKVKFWGVRGSLPCPGPQTMKYGGNTSCIELKFEGLNRIIIIDAGSGIRELGDYMMANSLSEGPMETEIFLTHTHWDHIMGFPFFTPMYIPGTKIKIYGPTTYDDESLKDIVGGLLTHRYFPVRQQELASEIVYIDLNEGKFNLGDGIVLTAKLLNHPVLCLGYRFEYKDKVFCTAYDTEPYRNFFSTDPNDPSYDNAMAIKGKQVAKEENHRLEKFYEKSDLIIYDTQYTQKEYEDLRIGWGHSSFEYAISSARRSNSKQLVFFHHDPARTDEQIDKLTEKYCCSERTESTKVLFAREGMEIEV